LSDDDIRPLFPLPARAAAPAAARSLGTALPTLATPPVTSPWSPRPVAPPPPAPEPAAPAPSPTELAAIREEAREQGYADGLAQTAALRDLLSDLLDELAIARAELAAPAAELIAEIAALVVETWSQHADRGALFAPVVRGWIEHAPAEPARVRVHPGDAAALAAVIGDAALVIVPDPAIAPGALEIRGAALELSHDWATRSAELCAAIAAAIATPVAPAHAASGAHAGGEP
jgi:flagellar assembly protein FliH